MSASSVSDRIHKEIEQMFKSRQLTRWQRIKRDIKGIMNSHD